MNESNPCKHETEATCRLYLFRNEIPVETIVGSSHLLKGAWVRMFRAAGDALQRDVRRMIDVLSQGQRGQ